MEDIDIKKGDSKDTNDGQAIQKEKTEPSIITK